MIQHLIGIHSLSLLSLFLQSVSELNNSFSFFTIDKRVHSQYIFGKHPAPIKEVRWQPTQDYLLVLCTDDSVSVWEVSLFNCPTFKITFIHLFFFVEA
jgi:WD40 repeat protein